MLHCITFFFSFISYEVQEIRDCLNWYIELQHESDKTFSLLKFTTKNHVCVHYLKLVNVHPDILVLSRTERGGERETYFINPSKSSAERRHSLPKPSVIRSSGVSVPRTAITTDFRWCKTKIKYAALHSSWKGKNPHKVIKTSVKYEKRITIE